MDKLVPAARIILGFIFTVFGFNGFFNFIPIPPPNEAMGAMMGGLAASGYFFPFLKITEIVCGLMLLANKFVPLSLIILAPIVVNILFVHVFVDRGGMPMAVFLTVLSVFLGKSYMSSFKGVLQANAKAG